MFPGLMSRWTTLAAWTKSRARAIWRATSTTLPTCSLVDWETLTQIAVLGYRHNEIIFRLLSLFFDLRVDQRDNVFMWMLAQNFHFALEALYSIQLFQPFERLLIGLSSREIGNPENEALSTFPKASEVFPALPIDCRGQNSGSLCLLHARRAGRWMAQLAT